MRVVAFIVPLTFLANIRAVGQQESTDVSDDYACVHLGPDAVAAISGLHSPPRQERIANSACLFTRTSNPTDGATYATLTLERDFSFGNLAGATSFTPDHITEIENTVGLKCEPPFTIEKRPALLCSGNAGRKTLWVIVGKRIKTISVDGRFVNGVDAGKVVVQLAEVAIFDRELPPDVSAKNAQWVHTPKNLKSGVWQLIQKSKGSGYLGLATGPAAFLTCITDGGAKLQHLVPQPLEGCSIKVQHPSPKEEIVAGSCEPTPGGDPYFADLSSTFRINLSFTDAEHYTIEGTKSQLQTFREQAGLVTYKKAIGEESMALEAHWVKDECGFQPALPIPVTASSILKR